MALDLGIGDGTSRLPVQGEPSLAFRSDGYYWFLHPLFEQLRIETGQYIDLYGDALFSGESLDALERMVAEAKRLVASQPDTWRVHIGTQTSPKQKELYDEVEKGRFLELLDQWQRILARARESGWPVICFGD